MPIIVTNKTYNELDALIALSQLDLALSYKITDRGDCGLLFRAATTNQLEFDGIRYMLCPATYAATTDAYDNVWIGVWNATKQATAAENDLTIWNGLVWKAGATLAGTAPDAEASGWVVVPKASFTNHEYIEMIFGISYDFANDWISKQWDSFGNVIGLPKIYSLLINSTSINYIDYTDWNLASSGGFLFGNTCERICNNNADIICNNNVIIIERNNVSEISGNNISGMGIIFGNNVASITNNRNTGNIVDNSSLPESTCNITKNGPGTGVITGVWNTDVTDTITDKTGTAS